jgi:hypothetical protein
MPAKKSLPVKAVGSDAQAAGGNTSSSEAPSQAQSREEQVRFAAYLAAERRGFAPGYEVQDWITAEQKVNAATDGSEGAKQT